MHRIWNWHGHGWGKNECDSCGTRILYETEAVAAAKPGLSPLTVNRVFSTFQSMPEEELTMENLANELSITKRSAKRFLSALCLTGVVEVKMQKRSTSRGRPERGYVINTTVRNLV